MREGRVVFSEMTENGRISSVVETADADSFVQFPNYGYARDRKHVFWRGSVIEEADPETFECLEYDYSRDREKVFWRDRTIVGADPSSFSILKGSDLWSRDVHEVFYADKALGVRSPNNFHVIDESWAADGVAYYYIAQFVPKGPLRSDYKSTRLLNGAYAVDKDQVYFRTHLILGADPKTFRPLNEWYAVDAKNAYFEFMPILGADLLTFRQEGHYHTAKDKYHTYLFGKPQ